MLHLVSVHSSKVRHDYREIKVSVECKRQIRLKNILGPVHIFSKRHISYPKWCERGLNLNDFCMKLLIIFLFKYKKQ